MKFVQVIELFEDSSAANHTYRRGTAGSRGLGAAQNSGWLHLTASAIFVLFLPNVKSHQFVKDACLAIPLQVHVAQHDPGDYGFGLDRPNFSRTPAMPAGKYRHPVI